MTTRRERLAKQNDLIDEIVREKILEVINIVGSCIDKSASREDRAKAKAMFTKFKPLLVIGYLDGEGDGVEEEVEEEMQNGGVVTDEVRAEAYDLFIKHRAALLKEIKL